MAAIFLDLDGTLVDSAPGITQSFHRTLCELGAEAPEPADLTWCIGPPLRDSFAVLLGEGADLDGAVARYREIYADEGIFAADIFEGIGDMLDALRATGRPLFVATSKLETHAREVADHFGLSWYLDGVFGSLGDGSRADKAALLAHALAETGAAPADSLMLGDRQHDVIGARANGMRCLGVLWGFADDGELHLAEADALAAAPQEVAEIVADLLGLETPP